MSINRGMDIKMLLHIYTMDYCSAINKNTIMTFAATRMDLEIIILNKVKSEKESQIPYDITYIWNLIYGTNEPFYRKETNS